MWNENRTKLNLVFKNSVINESPIKNIFKIVLTLTKKTKNYMRKERKKKPPQKKLKASKQTFAGSESVYLNGF